MQNVLINSLLGFFILFTACKSGKNNLDVASESTSSNYLKDSLSFKNLELTEADLKKDSVETLYTETFKDTLSGNTYDVIFNTLGGIKEYKLHYESLGKIKTYENLYDSLGLANEFDCPVKINLNYKNRSIQKLLIRQLGYFFEFDLVEKNPDTLIFKSVAYSGVTEGDSVLFTRKNNKFTVDEAYYISYKNQLYYKRKVAKNSSEADLTEFDFGSPKKIMNTNDFDISLNKEKETIFDVMFKTYGEIDGIYFRHKELYEDILKEEITEDLKTIKVNITNKTEGKNYAFKIFPVEDNFYPQEYKLLKNKNNTTSFIMKHKHPFDTETVYSDSIIFYKNTNKIKAAYRVYSDGDSVKLKINNLNGVNEVCGYFGTYDSEGCID